MTFQGKDSKFKIQNETTPLIAFWSRLNGSALKLFLKLHTMKIKPYFSGSGSKGYIYSDVETAYINNNPLWTVLLSSNRLKKHKRTVHLAGLAFSGPGTASGTSSGGDGIGSDSDVLSSSTPLELGADVLVWSSVSTWSRWNQSQPLLVMIIHLFWRWQ